MSSTLLDEPAAHESTAAAERLRTTMAAVRVSFTWLGVRKTLTAEQQAEAAEPFGANAQFLSAGKKLIDTSHPAYKAVTAVRGKVQSYWKSLSLPYPEPGIRLIRQDRIDEFAAKMREFQEELAEAVETLDRRYSELKATARQRLGSLLRHRRLSRVAARHVLLEFDFPNVQAAGLPCSNSTRALYEEECRRVQSRFDEAVRLAEEAFTAELAKLVSHLTERLSGQEDGKPKTFRNSAVEESDRVLPAVPRVERPFQRATRSARRPGTAGHPRRRATGLAGQRRAAAARRHRDEPGAVGARWAARRPAPAEHPAPPEVTVIAMQLIIAPDGAVRRPHRSREVDHSNTV